ncbi:sensor histidine kinase [Melioribacter sp. OK-6-Me]|uniref:sensor histidine kinase n=1 Tax=unclassified Melioribacter TaxID=2627329 RepID=UPI003ED8F022
MMKLKNEYYSHLVIIELTALTIIALIVAIQHYLVFDPEANQSFSLIWHISFNLVYWYYWLFITPLLFFAFERFGKNRIAGKVFLYFLLPLIIVSLHQILSAIIIYGFLDFLDVKTLIYKRIFRSQWAWVDLVVFFVISVGINITESRKKYEEEEIEMWKLKSELAAVRLKRLKNQFHPHFIFNTFNTISTLILKREKEKAIEVIENLRALFRKAAEEGTNEFVTLHEEISFVQTYLQIEKVRLSERLEIKYAIDETLLDALIPPFILQPLVENSIRHGISKNKSKGIICISAEKNHNKLEIKIEDNCHNCNGNKIEKSGVGLKIVEHQLSYLFKDDYYFSAEQTSSGFVNRISIPIIKKLN